MNNINRLALLPAALAASLATPSHAQSPLTARMHCLTVGVSTQEPLGDREGHSLSTGQLSCRVEGGPLDGGLMTAHTVYEWDKGTGVLLSGNGVTRKPGSISAFQHLEGKVALTVVDGKVTGATSTGKGRVTLATGAAALLKGKTYSFTTRSTGPGQIVVDVQYD